jgi:hypothetical protein
VVTDCTQPRAGEDEEDTAYTLFEAGRGNTQFNPLKNTIPQFISFFPFLALLRGEQNY